MYERYSWRCVLLLVISSVFGMVVMVPLYVASANEFECGASWHKATLAYLSGSYALEVAAAVLISAATALQAFGVLLIWCWVRDQHAAQIEQIETIRVAASTEALPVWQQEMRACLHTGELLPEQYSTHMHWRRATNEHMGTTIPKPMASIKWLWVGPVWALLVLVFSAPTFFAMLALSVPGGQNTLGMSQIQLDVAFKVRQIKTDALFCLF